MYEEYNKYNLNKLYNIFRTSFIEHVQKIVDENIEMRRAMDMTLQYAPSAAGVIAFTVLTTFAAKYNFTLLKEMWERSNLLTMFAVLSVIAILSGLGIYRNLKKYKRPKMFKYSLGTVVVYVLMTITFFSMYGYYINRYDGYDDTYYYIYGNNNSIIIDGLFNEEKLKYTIPAEIDDLSVEEVSKKTFKKNKSVQEVVFTDSNATIEESSFKNCWNLRLVVLGDRDYIIGDNTFEECINLATIENSDRITYIGEKAFYDCSKLKSISFGKEITNIKSEAFANCTSINNIEIPKALTSVSNDAFSGCRNITTLTLQNDNAVNSIDSTFGSSAGKIESLYLNNYSNIPNDFADGMPKLRTITITGENVTIGNSSFANDEVLDSVIINGSLIRVGDSGFEGCKNLRSINCTNIDRKSVV